MSKRNKLIQQIFEGKAISTSEAIKILEFLGFETLKTSGTSHITYTKDDSSITLVRNRNELKKYQLKDLQEILHKEGYKNE